jgi:hypothetical protein
LLNIDRKTCKVQLPSGPTDFRTTTVNPFLRTDTDAESDPGTPQEPIPHTDTDTIEVQVPDGHESACQNTVDTSIFLQGDNNPLNDPPFTGLRQKELNGLLERGVFEVVDLADVPPGTCIFYSRFVDEIKNPGTDKAFEKSRLVVQAYRDLEKDLVLIQSPTAQRVSQRLILALTILLPELSIYLHDIT